MEIAHEARLAGKRILLVEDDAMIAMAMEFLLSDSGAAVVGPAGSLDGAMTLADAGGLDCALLDVRLGHEDVYPLADRLARAKVPFLFLSGHGRGNIPANHAKRTCLSKPCDSERLLRVIEHLVGNA